MISGITRGDCSKVSSDAWKDGAAGSGSPFRAKPQLTDRMFRAVDTEFPGGATAFSKASFTTQLGKYLSRMWEIRERRLIDHPLEFSVALEERGGGYRTHTYLAARTKEGFIVQPLADYAPPGFAQPRKTGIFVTGGSALYNNRPIHTLGAEEENAVKAILAAATGHFSIPPG